MERFCSPSILLSIYAILFAVVGIAAVLLNSYLGRLNESESRRRLLACERFCFVIMVLASCIFSLIILTPVMCSFLANALNIDDDFQFRFAEAVLYLFTCLLSCIVVVVIYQTNRMHRMASHELAFFRKRK